MKQSNSWHNYIQPHDELHLREAEDAFVGALCVGIMLSWSPRAAQGVHEEECEGKAAVLAAELMKEHLKRTLCLLMPYSDTGNLTILTLPGIHDSLA